MMLCFFHKYRISRALDTDTLPGRLTTSHLAHCDSCRSFQARARALGEQLQRDADDLAARVSDDLHVRILRRCGLTADAEADAANPAAKPKRPRPAPMLLRVRPGWVLAAAAMVLLAIGLSYMLPGGQPPVPPGPGPRIVQPPKPPAPSVEDSPLAIVVDLARPVDVESVDQPLTDEMDRLREHGKATAEFLLACVPVDLGLQGK